MAKISKFLRYNLRTGGNINTNERKRWYGLELYQGMNNQGYLAISNLDKSNYSVENLVMYNTKLGSWGKFGWYSRYDLRGLQFLEQKCCRNQVFCNGNARKWYAHGRFS